MNKRRMNQRLRQKTELDKGLLNRGWHSKSYHRHFEGYTEIEETNEKGKTVIKRVYVGDYHRLDLPKSERIRLRLVYLGLIVLAGGLFGFAASRPVGANMSWYLAVSQMLVIGGIGAMLVNLLAHTTAPRDMTVGDFKGSSKALQKSSKFTALMLELTAFLTALYLLLNGENWLWHLLCIVIYAVAGVICMVINRLEANAPYLTYHSTEIPPEDGAYIDA